MIAANNGSYPVSTPRTGSRPEGAVLDRLTREAIDAQARAGLDVVTDGLARREDPVSHVAGRLEGVVLGDAWTTLPGSGARCRVPTVGAEIAWRSPLLVEDYLFAVTGQSRPIKPVLLGPYTLSRVALDRAYQDPMEVAMGFAIAINAELRALQAAGAGWAQIDEPALLDRREDFPTFTRIWEVLGRGVQLNLCLHLEGGDVRGLYPGVARLKRLACLSLDCVRGRASLDLLGEVPWPPGGPLLGLGLVDGASARVEEAGEIAALLRSTAGLPPRERIVLGTASDLGGLPAGTAFAKLQALTGARDQA